MEIRGIDASGGGADGEPEDALRLQRAMLLAGGELGFGRVTVAEVASRAGLSAEDFERCFSSLRECFTRAYAAESGRLCDRILGAGAEQADWRGGLRAALLELAAYVEENPAITKALLVEVHVAGRDAFACRTERLERLSRALDSARRETESRHSPPPLTALFMVSTIEAAVVSVLSRDKPGEFLKVVPELELLVSRAYFCE